MADNLASFKVFCQGGLNTSRDVLSQGETQPGSAVKLTNYEPSVTGGYRNITFYCRRKDEKLGVSLGYLGPPVIPELSQSEIPNLDSLFQAVERDKETEEHRKMREQLEREEEILNDIPDLEEDLEEMSESNIKPLTPKRNEKKFSPKKLSSYRKGSILPRM